MPTDHPTPFDATITTNRTGKNDDSAEFLLDYEFLSYEHFGFKPTITFPDRNPYAELTLTHIQTLDLYRFLRSQHRADPNQTCLVFPDGRNATAPRPIDELDPSDL